MAPAEKLSIEVSKLVKNDESSLVVVTGAVSSARASVVKSGKEAIVPSTPESVLDTFTNTVNSACGSSSNQ